MWGIVRADLTAAFRRVEELVFIFVASVAAGVLGSFAGAMSIYLVALLSSQLAAYLYVIRDWDRGVLEGLIYYIGHVGVYISKLVVACVVAVSATVLASLFIDIAAAPSAAVAALLLSATSSLAALFAVYGGLPPPAATAMAVVLALPPVVAIVRSGVEVVQLAATALVIVVGVLTSALLDRS
ncbi:hypothetical protein [Pyrobaculum sp.]|mgnify:CR=1 FL=1|uniref:hypothetical protein n=1 Tax=Pyrobaculum sp. TaxID=2004705 RepID=UPI00317ADB83